MNAQNTNAVNPSVILPFVAICNLEAPTTELDPDFAPSVWLCAGEFKTLIEAKAACYAYADNPALITMHCSQCWRCKMTTQTIKAVNLSLIRWTAICYLPSDDVFVSAFHVVGTLFNNEAEAKQAAIAYSNTHPCIAYLAYQQAVNASKIAQDCRATATALSADIGLSVVEANHA